MKKLILILAFALCGGLFAAAQEGEGSPLGFGFRMGYSLKPATGSDYFYGSFQGVGVDDTRLSTIYHDYHGPIWSTGTFSATADLYIKSWFLVGLNAGWVKFSTPTYDGITDAQKGTQEGTALYVLPMAYCFYLNRTWYRLYGGLGFGVGFYSDFFDKKVRLEPQFTPLAAEVGRKLFGFVELGYGSLFCGFRAGLGYKF